MPFVNLKPETLRALRNLADGYMITEETLEKIDSNATFTKMLNDFVERHGTSSDAIILGNSDEYRHGEDIILLNPAKWARPENQCDGVIALAHEVAHALSSYRWDMSSSLDDYVHMRNMGEGEALYHEFLALKEMYPEVKSFWPTLWKDNQGEMTNPDYNNITENYYDHIDGIIASYENDPEEMYKRLGELKAIQIRSGNADFGFTYDEFNKLYWLLSNTDIGLEYLKAKGRDTDHDGLPLDENATLEAIEGVIFRDITYLWDLKVLLNKAHKGRPAVGGHEATDYFGTDFDDVLRAEENGSVLGLINGREVLWGGKGEDVLHGSNVQDILMGGDDDDRLYGGADDDHLYGGADADELDGGAGNDRLEGGTGLDTYFIGQDHDSIFDEDNHGIICNGSLSDQLTGGTMTRVNGIANNIYRSDDGRYEYVFLPGQAEGPGSELGQLAIYMVVSGKRADSPLVTIDNFTNPASGAAAEGNNLGLTLVVEDRAPLAEKYDITAQSYDRVTMNAGGYVDTGVLSDWVTGSAFDDIIYFATDQEYFYKKSA